MNDLPTDLPRHYRYSMEQVFFAGSWRYNYKLVGRHGGMNLHISGPHHYDSADHWSAGLETHYRQPPRYMCDQPPSQDECWLLKCPCWHDGTSLYAQEEYLPMFLRKDHTGILRQMARDADRKFTEDSDA